ncbi:hypothetical protein BU15DRAFT_63320 [Melanogaster broomeanus]|nr:hypothetical protein BU15DRAFT_63320 [Melanogaster broomeanus]
MASPPPEIRGVFTAMNTGPFIISVDDWQLLLNMQAGQTSRCFIEDIVHYKCTEGKEHEFLRLQISHPAGPWKAFVFCDRTVNTSNDNRDPVQSHRAALLCSSSTPSFGNFPAMDIIYAASANSTALKELYLGRFSDKHTHVRTLTYNTKGAQPSVLDVAMLLKVTSCHAPLYRIYENQCYWFSDTVYDTLAHLFPDHRTSTNTHKGGTYRSVDVPMADSVEKVCAAYCSERSAAEERAKEERRQQEAALKAEREQGREQGLELGREQGRAEVQADLKAEREQGREQGLEQGLELGREQGRAEVQAAFAAWQSELLTRMEELEARARPTAASN